MTTDARLASLHRLHQQVEQELAHALAHKSTDDSDIKTEIAKTRNQATNGKVAAGLVSEHIFRAQIVEIARLRSGGFFVLKCGLCRLRCLTQIRVAAGNGSATGVAPMALFRGIFQHFTGAALLLGKFCKTALFTPGGFRNDFIKLNLRAQSKVTGSIGVILLIFQCDRSRML